MTIPTDDELNAMSQNDRKELAVRAAAGLDPAGRLNVASTLAGLPQPSSRVADAIWIIVVVAFAIAFLAAVALLLFGRFSSLKAEEGEIFTSTETIVTIFTTTAAFLAGLLAPSPVTPKS